MTSNHKPLKQRKRRRKLKNKAQLRTGNRVRKLRAKRTARALFHRQLSGHGLTLRKNDRQAEDVEQS